MVRIFFHYESVCDEEIQETCFEGMPKEYSFEDDIYGLFDDPMDPLGTVPKAKRNKSCGRCIKGGLDNSGTRCGTRWEIGERAAPPDCPLKKWLNMN